MTSHKIIKILMLSLICIALGGCYKQISGTIRSSHDSTGKAYNYAQIELVAEDDLKKHLKSKINEDKSEVVNRLKSSIKIKNEKLEKLQINLSKISKLLGEASFATGYYGNSWQEKLRYENDSNSLQREVSKTVNNAREFSKQLEDIKNTIKQDERKIENIINGRDGAFYFSDKITEMDERTDLDGKFKLRYFSNNQMYILIRRMDKFWCLKLIGNSVDLYLSDADVVELNSSNYSCPNISDLYK